jgi:hypothetical protein
MTRGSRRGRTGQVRHAEVGLTFSCAVCGRPIMLIADEFSVSLPDRAGFLETHARCLAQRRDIQWPRP